MAKKETDMQELIDQYNAAAEGAGIKTIKTFRGTEDALRAKIKAMVAAAKAAKKGKAAKEKGDKPPRITVVSIVRECFEEGITDNQKIIDRVKKKLPDAKTSINSIRWYKSNLNKE
jgi:hypothetical protein